MRIGIICPYNLDVPGGVQSQVIGSARAFGARGHHVMILAPGKTGRSDLSDGVELELLGKTVGIPANGSVAPIALSPRALQLLGRRLKAFGPGAVLVHEPFVPLVSLGASFLNSAPHFGVFHRAGSVRGLRSLRPLGATVARRFTGGVVVSEEARASALALVGAMARSYQLIPNAIDAERFSLATPISTTRPTVVFVGRHESRKGLEVLLQSLAMLPDDLELWIIGSGPDTLRLTHDYQDSRIAWLGRLNDDQVAERLGSADLFVAPSLSGESFGVILLEAMAAGTAVLCSDLAGYRLSAGDAARYVTPGDPNALAIELRRLIVDTHARAELVALGTSRMRAFTFADQIDQYLQLFERLEG